MSLAPAATAEFSLIHCVYETLFATSGATDLLSIIKSNYRAMGAFYVRLPSEHEVASVVASGVDREALTQAEILGGMAAAVVAVAHGTPLQVEVGPKGPRWANQLANGLGYQGSLLLVCLVRERQRCLILGLIFDEEAQQRLGQVHSSLVTITPHLQMAIALQRKLAAEREKAERIDRLFSQSPVARAIVDKDLLIHEHNAAFERLILCNRAPISAIDGYVHIAKPEFRQEITRLMQTASHSHAANNLAWIKDSGISLGWFLRVDLVGSRLLSSNPFQQMDAPQTNRYMLSVYEVGDQSSLSANVIGTVLGLSGAESELACELARGSAPAEIAQSRGVAKNTVHNQLTSIMTRHGFHRQGQLINLLSAMPLLL